MRAFFGGSKHVGGKRHSTSEPALVSGAGTAERHTWPLGCRRHTRPLGCRIQGGAHPGGCLGKDLSCWPEEGCLREGRPGLPSLELDGECGRAHTWEPSVKSRGRAHTARSPPGGAGGLRGSQWRSSWDGRTSALRGPEAKEEKRVGSGRGG